MLTFVKDRFQKRLTTLDTGTLTSEFVAETHFLSNMELNKFAFLTLKHSMKISGETRLEIRSSNTAYNPSWIVKTFIQSVFTNL